MESPRTRHRRRSEEQRVIFHRTVSVRSVECIDDLSNDEHQAIWYSSYDMEKFRHRDKKLRASVSDAPVDDQEVLMRVFGLESPENKLSRQKRIENCRNAVLAEQEDQWDEETCSPVAIARISRRYSLQSVVAAQRRGSEVAYSIVEDVVREYNASEDPKSKYGFEEGQMRLLKKLRDRGRRTRSFGSRRTASSRSKSPRAGRRPKRASEGDITRTSPASRLNSYLTKWNNARDDSILRIPNRR